MIQCLRWVWVSGSYWGALRHLLECTPPAGWRCCCGNQGDWGSSAQTWERHVLLNEHWLLKNIQCIRPLHQLCTEELDIGRRTNVWAFWQPPWWPCCRFQDRMQLPRRPSQRPLSLRLHLRDKQRSMPEVKGTGGYHGNQSRGSKYFRSVPTPALLCLSV